MSFKQGFSLESPKLWLKGGNKGGSLRTSLVVWCLRLCASNVPVQGVRVCPLVTELRSHMTRGVAPPPKKNQRRQPLHGM